MAPSSFDTVPLVRAPTDTPVRAIESALLNNQHALASMLERVIQTQQSLREEVFKLTMAVEALKSPGAMPTTAAPTQAQALPTGRRYGKSHDKTQTPVLVEDKPQTSRR